MKRRGEARSGTTAIRGQTDDAPLHTPLLEVCASSYTSALNAQAGGADRIEFCTELSVGGLTPSHDEILAVKQALDIPVFVLIRPRAGNFLYSAQELEQMKADILFCKKAGCEGVVFGVLDHAGRPDLTAMKALIKAAQGMQLTFHRAFDAIQAPEKTMQALADLGFHRILTSGPGTRAVDHIDTLRDWVSAGEGSISIMPGGSIRPDNIKALLQTGAREFHSSCIPPGEAETAAEMVTELKALLL